MFKKYSRKPFTGCSVDYYDNGQLRSKENWKDGKPDGLWEEYHDNGKLSSKGNFKKGELNGLWEYYDEKR